MIDVSYNSVRSGLLDFICHILKTDLLDYLPKYETNFLLLTTNFVVAEIKIVRRRTFASVSPRSINKFISTTSKYVADPEDSVLLIVTFFSLLFVSPGGK